MTNFDQHLELYCKRLQEAINKEFAAHYPRNLVPKITFTTGPKYVRIIRGGSVGKAVHCFVERSTGSIWKAAGWKAPAKNFPRGNIFNPGYTPTAHAP